MVDLFSNQKNARVMDLATLADTKWRIMLYGIDPIWNQNIDLTDLRTLVWYGELICYDTANDTSSNRRISANGIKITDFYNKDVDYQIGGSTCSEIEIDFINDDGFMNSGGTYPQHFPWEWTYALFADMWDPDNNDWISVPLGMYWFEKPEKTSGTIVHAKGYDTMRRIENCSAEGLFDNVDWSTRPTLLDMYNLLETHINTKLADQRVSYIGIFAGLRCWFADTNGGATLTNSTYYYVSQPFDPAKYNCRQVLEMLAGAAAANAYVSRDGYVKLRPFAPARWKLYPNGEWIYYTIDTTSGPTDLIEISLGEYSVPVIDRLRVMYGSEHTIRSVGSGQNMMIVSNNEFYKLLLASGMLQNVYDVVSALATSNPMTMKAFISPLIEAGDTIRVVRDGTTYTVPIFSQTITWKGGLFTSEIVCTGNEFRQVDSARIEQYYNEAEKSELKEDVGTAQSDISDLQDAVNTLGTIVTDSPSAYISVPTGSWTEIASITLDAGTYIIIGFAQFLHSSSGTGTTRRIVVSNASGSSTAAGRGLISTGVPPSGVASDETCATFFEVAQLQTYYLNAYHDAGVNIAVYPKLSAMRIK